MEAIWGIFVYVDEICIFEKVETKRLKDRAPQTTAFGIYLGFDKWSNNKNVCSLRSNALIVYEKLNDKMKLNKENENLDI